MMAKLPCTTYPAVGKRVKVFGYDRFSERRYYCEGTVVDMFFPNELPKIDLVRLYYGSDVGYKRTKYLRLVIQKMDEDYAIVPFLPRNYDFYVVDN